MAASEHPEGHPREHTTTADLKVVRDDGDATSTGEHEIEVAEEPAPEPEDESTLRVTRPDKLLRIVAMIRGLMTQVGPEDLDEAGRTRLAEAHNRAVEQLEEIVSEELLEELEELALARIDGTPTLGELRVMQAQFGGWLEGLFHGVQASTADSGEIAEQLAARIAAGEQDPEAGDDPKSTGQYL